MHSRAFAVAAVLAACTPRLAPAAPEAPARAGPWSVELVDASGNPLPTFAHRGRVHVLGALGERYAVRVRNGSGERVEVVVSVDGRDVVDGRPSSLEKRGYIVAPWGEVTVDGFRLDEGRVAAFRFASVPRSYAARMGDARDVGVVGVAVFPERHAVALVPPRYEPMPAPGEPWEDRAERSDVAPPRAGAEPSAPAGAPAPPSAKSSGGAAAQGEAHASRRAEARPGLGTEFGEARGSPVERVGFERARPRPDAVLAVRYDDRAGLVALGIDVDGGGLARRDEAWRREHATPFRRDPGYAEPPPGWYGR